MVEQGPSVPLHRLAVRDSPLDQPSPSHHPPQQHAIRTDFASSHSRFGGKQPFWGFYQVEKQKDDSAIISHPHSQKRKINKTTNIFIFSNMFIKIFLCHKIYTHSVILTLVHL